MSSDSKLGQVARKAEHQVHLGAEATQGKVPNSDKALGHPIHPATVHWPIAFLSATFGCNALSLLSTTSAYPAFLPSPASLPALTKYTAAAGVITAIPALITGIGEGYELIRAQYLQKGSWSKLFDDAWNMKDEGGRKVKMTVKHASMNDAAVLLAGLNWQARSRIVYYTWKFPNAPLPKVILVLGTLAFPALLYSAQLGGKLVYEYAVGVQRQGSGLEEKKSQ